MFMLLLRCLSVFTAFTALSTVALPQPRLCCGADVRLMPDNRPLPDVPENDFYNKKIQIFVSIHRFSYICTSLK